MASTDARPVPIKNTAYRVYFPILDADGDLVTGAAGLDSEVSLDGAAFADCTNEATEVGTSGSYYLDLTAAEMNADAVVVLVKTSTSGAKTTPIYLYPQESGDIKVDVQSAAGTAWGSGAITAGSIAANAITAAKVATDAIGAAQLATDAVTEIQSGLSTLTAAGIRTAVGLASANLDTQLGAIDDYIDAEIGQIKTVTDLIPATKLAQHAAAVLAVVVGVGSTTTAVKLSTVEGGAPSAVDDFYNGAVIVFTSGALAGQRTSITDYVGATTTATVVALTGSPANAVTAIIV